MACSGNGRCVSGVCGVCTFCVIDASSMLKGSLVVLACQCHLFRMSRSRSPRRDRSLTPTELESTEGSETEEMLLRYELQSRLPRCDASKDDDGDVVFISMTTGAGLNSATTAARSNMASKATTTAAATVANDPSKTATATTATSTTRATTTPGPRRPWTRSLGSKPHKTIDAVTATSCSSSSPGQPGTPWLDPVLARRIVWPDWGAATST